MAYHPSNQRGNDPLYCAGANYRQGRNQVPINVRERLYYPEIGSMFVCVACQKCFSDLQTHQRQKCSDYNALVKIHNGYIDQFHAGQAPPDVNQAYHIPGAVYHLVKVTFGLNAIDIVGPQGPWGPYSPIPFRGRHGASAPLWANLDALGYNTTTYNDLVIQVTNSFPPTFTTPVRVDPRMRGVHRALTDVHSYSILHEMHVEEEKLQMQHIQDFIDGNNPSLREHLEAHPILNVPDWTHTYIYRAKHPPTGAQLAENASVWLCLSPANGGVANQGRDGIASSLTQHRNRVEANPVGIPSANQIYEGLPAGAEIQGHFRMPGTPRRH